MPTVRGRFEELNGQTQEGGEEELFSLPALSPSGEGERADVFLARQLGITRSFAQKLIREGRLEKLSSGSLSSGSPAPVKTAITKPSRKIVPGETSFVVRVPPPETLEIEPEDVPFEVVYEDAFLLVVNKPAGLVVHPAPGHWRGTLVHGLLKRYPDMGPFNNVRRPGIVHRLDATTSGLMLVAREQRTMDLLQKAFRERTLEKRYLALARGTFAAAAREGVLEGPIGRHPAHRLKMAVVEGGRPSTTEYRVLWSRNGFSLVVCKLVTGRTHQIRVHMAAAGRPLAGDALYGAKETPLELGRVFLHSWRLAFTHPVTGQALRFACPLPKELRAYLTGIARRQNAAPHTFASPTTEDDGRALARPYARLNKSC
ncbi:MAG: RluA family pseudouridine synthase [Synergistaceae bacterium]|nr:RluA family pseudouridine synthase [Synergistaceae bacterium]